jgi:hypothetical protein
MAAYGCSDDETPVTTMVKTNAARLENAALSTAALSALCGTFLVAVMLAGSVPQYYFLTAASVAASISVAALLLNLFAVCQAAGTQLRTLRQTPGACATQEEAVDAMQVRGAVLNERLHIDPPSVCSQYQVPCTLWSLCGAPPASDSMAKEGVKVIPIVHRSGKSDCPLRFAAAAARPLTAGRPHARPPTSPRAP